MGFFHKERAITPAQRQRERETFSVNFFLLHNRATKIKDRAFVNVRVQRGWAERRI